MDKRRELLAHWAVALIEQIAGVAIAPELEMVSGDASFRRYFRLCHQHQSWIVVDAPTEQEDSTTFVNLAQCWHQQGIKVPEVLAHETEQGFMLLEDFGDRMFSTAVQQPGISEQQIKTHYHQAIEQLLLIQQLPADNLPVYDQALLLQEVHLFRDWLCEKQLQMSLSAGEQAMLDRLFQSLCDNALHQPQAVVHRDYHSRNLMLLADDTLGVIDFQDAVLGAATYDLVSLLRDCYVRWPNDWVQELANYYWQQSQALGIYAHDYDRFQRDFDWMGMQRHLKAAGIFARLHLRDGKPAYLHDIPNTCRYLSEVGQCYEDFGDFTDWLNTCFLSHLAQEAWS